jgi:hypothetical protein
LTRTRSPATGCRGTIVTGRSPLPCWASISLAQIRHMQQRFSAAQPVSLIRPY